MSLEIFDSGRKEFRTNREVFIRVGSVEGQMQVWCPQLIPWIHPHLKQALGSAWVSVTYALSAPQTRHLEVGPKVTGPEGEQKSWTCTGHSHPLLAAVSRHPDISNRNFPVTD